MKDGDMSSFSFNLEPTVDLARQPCEARVTRHSRTLALLNKIQVMSGTASNSLHGQCSIVRNIERPLKQITRAYTTTRGKY